MQAQYEKLPVYKKALDMTKYFENTVAGFSRYHPNAFSVHETKGEIDARTIQINSVKDNAKKMRKLPTQQRRRG